MKQLFRLILLLPCLACGSVFTQSRAELTSNQLIDLIDVVTCEDMLSRLDYFAKQIKKDESSKAYVIVYGRKIGKRGETAHFTEMVRSFFGNMEKMNPDLYQVVDGGFRDNSKVSLELWAWKQGSSAPSARATLSLDKVRFKGGVCKYRYATNKHFCETC